jgi:hypothetical protein
VLEEEGPTRHALAAETRWTTTASALLEPRRLPVDLLGECAVDYDARHVGLRDGALHYQRKCTGIPEPRRLYPASDDTFVMKEVDYFNMRFDRRPDGSVSRITGLYLDGRRDESLRDLY